MYFCRQGITTLVPGKGHGSNMEANSCWLLAASEVDAGKDRVIAVIG